MLLINIQIYFYLTIWIQNKKVENFIETLNQEKEDRELTSAYTKLSETAFSKVWDNPLDADYDQL